VSEAERLQLAGAYRRAYTETDLIARITCNAITGMQADSADPAVILTVLGPQLDRFSEAVTVEEAALKAMQDARNAA
jgi:hypothetical protein